MRFKDLRLIRYGHFENEALHFDRAPAGLHIVLGSNEAGKSTTLRAVQSLLFGFPGQSPDNFRFLYNKLRVGAEMERADGTSQVFVRRKGTGSTLRDLQDEVLADSLMASFLGGVDQRLFDRLYCLDLSDVQDGSANLDAGKGDLAEALFSAGSGVGQLQEVLQALDRDAEAYFKPGGTKNPGKILSLVKEYEEHLGSVKLLTVPSSQWEQYTQELDDLRRKQDEMRDNVSRLYAERSQLSRIGRCGPRVARRREIIRELGEIGEVPDLPHDARDRRLNATQLRNVEASSVRRVRADIAQRVQALDMLSVEQPLLDRKAELADIALALGEVLKSERDLPTRKGEQRQIEASATQLVSEILAGTTLDQLERLRVSVASKAIIRALVTEHSTVGERKRSAQALRDAAADKLNILLRDVPVGTADDPSRLSSATERALTEGDIDSKIEEVEGMIRSRQERLARGVARLGRTDADVDKIADLPAPFAETITEFETRFSSASGPLESAAQACERLEKDLAAATAEFHEMGSTGHIPSEAELFAARQRREEGWQLVRAAWLDSLTDEAQWRNYAGEASLPEAYEGAVTRADEIGDRLRLDAARVATLSALKTRISTLTAELDAASSARNSRLDEYNRVSTAWIEVWRPSGMEPGTPTQMQAWLGALEGLKKEAAEQVAAREELGRLRRRSEKMAHVLSAEMEAVGQPPMMENEQIGLFVQRCREAVESIRKKQSAREDLELRDADLARALEEFADWRRRWDEAIKGLPCLAGLDPAPAAAVLDKLDQLFIEEKSLADMRSRVVGIEDDIRRFGERVSLLCGAVAPDLANLPARSAAQELATRLRLSEDNLKARETAETEISRRKEELRGHERKLGEAEAEIQTLLELSGAPDLESHETIETRAERVRALNADRERTELELTEESSGLTLQALIEAVEQSDLDAVRARIEEIDVLVKSLDEQRSPIDEEIGRVKLTMARIDGKDEAAQSEQEAEAALGQARDGVDRYMRLRLAVSILREGIDRYRKGHQTQLLARAEELFRRMTLGSFERLDVACEIDKTVLRAIRRVGDDTEEVAVSGMSDGTRDQLYLALRLASVEQQIASTPEPLPLIVDDILVNFDDERSFATLEILAEIARKTQILFFTHHSRLVDLASKLDPAHHVAFHHLGESPA